MKVIEFLKQWFGFNLLREDPEEEEKEMEKRKRKLEREFGKNPKPFESCLPKV